VLREAGVELTILSDNFDLIVRYLLEKNGLSDVPFFANRLEFVDGRAVPSFPFTNPECPNCAHCKKTHFLPPNDDARQVIYIGDGRSDRCPARHADLVFAKDSLLTYLRAEQIACTPYRSLSDIADSLHILLHENSP